MKNTVSIGRKSANALTALRVLLSVALPFAKPFSVLFYVIYLVAGISDMLDGSIARRTGSATEFGAKLDTGADIVFAGVCLAVLLPVLKLPLWVTVWIGLIALIKTVNILWVLCREKRFFADHSAGNKLTGVLLFFFPLTVPFVNVICSAAVLCSVATIAAFHEGCEIFVRGKTK